MIKLKTLLEKQENDLDSTSGVIIEHNNKILVMRKAEGNYSIPKGHMQIGETPRQAMHRELKEETQIVLPTEPKFLYKVERPIKKGGNFMYVFHYESDKELTPVLDHEHTDFGYYDKDTIPEDIYYLKEFLK